MKVFAIVLLSCCSILASELPLSFDAAFLFKLPQSSPDPFKLPHPNIAVAAPEVQLRPNPSPVFPKDTHTLIRSAARKHKVPTAFVRSIVAAESNFDPTAISPKGAIGLMQLMPETAQALGADPKIPEQNIEAGTHYLRMLMDRYHKYRDWIRRVIAAYNAGPAMVDRYRGVPPFKETRNYVVRVLNFMRYFEREGS